MRQGQETIMQILFTIGGSFLGELADGICLLLFKLLGQCLLEGELLSGRAGSIVLVDLLVLRELVFVLD